MHKKFLRLLFSFFVMSLFISTVYADETNSPIGQWITVSDKTHDNSGVVEIFEQEHKLYGKVIKIFPGSGRDPKELCVKCSGDLKDKPVLGMIFLWGFQAHGNNTWVNGKVLDPHEGQIYRGSMTLIDNGQHLKLRGYWGPFWRTQTWTRVEKK